MLLITRREDEAIVINGDILVKVVEIRSGRVKLGFQFPEGNTVYREELFTKIQAENRAAASAPAKAIPLARVLQSLGKHGNPPVPLTNRKPSHEPTSPPSHGDTPDEQ